MAIKKIIDRAIPLSDITGKLLPVLEPYEIDLIRTTLSEGKRLYFLGGLGTEIKPVSDPMRAFFFGHVFNWVTSVYEKYTQETVKGDAKDRQLFGRRMLEAIYKAETETIQFKGLQIVMEIDPISFSSNGSDMGKLLNAIDVWTSWFATELGETFPQPDPHYKLKTTTVKVTKKKSND